MYTRYFGLHQRPFSIAPDPRYLFMSERHREALAHLLYGLNGGGGFVLLTGEIGAGKTTVCRLFLEQIPAHCNVAYIFNPRQSVVELLQSICDEFAIDFPRGKEDAPGPSVKDLIDPLNRFLLQAHRNQKNSILIIDEAQNLSADVLEQLRLLTNLETTERKLLQIVLIGQPELRTMLARPELEQLAQRIIARFHLGSLSADETAQYVAHRLAVAGNAGGSPFSPRVMRRIHSHALGIPRRINLLCDRALLGAYARGSAVVDSSLTDMAAREVFDAVDSGAAGKKRYRTFIMTGLVLAVFVLVGTTPGFLTEVRKRMYIERRDAVALSPPPASAGATTQAPVPVAQDASMPVTPTAPGIDAAVDSASSALRPAGERAAQTVHAATVAVPAANGLYGSISINVRNFDLALRRLGNFWQLNLGDGDVCQLMREQALYCFVSKSGLNEVRQLDRPGILTLHDDDDNRYFALLLGLSGETATLQLGDVTETVSLKALAARWRGGFTTLWRGPANYRKPIAIGDRGAGVDWISLRLATAAGLAPPPANGIFDEALGLRLQQFQLTQGLTPDGVAGSQTLMRLAVAAGDNEPTLRADPAVLAGIAAKNNVQAGN